MGKTQFLSSYNIKSTNWHKEIYFSLKAKITVFCILDIICCQLVAESRGENAVLCDQDFPLFDTVCFPVIITFLCVYVIFITKTSISFCGCYDSSVATYLKMYKSFRTAKR